MQYKSVFANSSGNGLRKNLNLRMTLFLVLFAEIIHIKCGFCVSVKSVRDGGTAYLIAAVAIAHIAIPYAILSVIVLF